MSVAPRFVRVLGGLAGIAWLVLAIAGFLGGLVYDRTPPRPEVHRAGYRVLEGDFHAHTTFSDGSLTPLGLVRQAERRGLDVIGVTEHNSVLPAKVARAWATRSDGAASSVTSSRPPVVVIGEEITTASFHLIALGLTRTVAANQPPKGVVADIHAQGGLAIAAHPVARYWPELLPVRGDLDGAEVVHPIAYSSRGGWRWSDMVQFYEEASPPVTAIGSSDYHWGSVLGLCRTLLFVNGPPSEGAVLEALHARRTVVIGPDGRYFGDAAMIAALEREPYVPRTADYAYHGEGTLDRMLRIMGWLGVAGMIFVGRSRKPPQPGTEALQG
jgi:hypothetical protein